MRPGIPGWQSAVARWEKDQARRAAWLASPPTFRGRLVAKAKDRSGSWFMSIVWVCKHEHPSRAEAIKCQKEERARRRLAAKATESKNRRRRPYAPLKPAASPRPQLMAKAARPAGGWATKPVKSQRHGHDGEIATARRARREALASMEVRS